MEGCAIIVYYNMSILRKENEGKKCSSDLAGFELGAVGLWGKRLNHLASTSKPHKRCTSIVGKLPRSSIYSMRARGGIIGVGVEYQELLHDNGPIRLL